MCSACPNQYLTGNFSQASAYLNQACFHVMIDFLLMRSRRYYMDCRVQDTTYIVVSHCQSTCISDDSNNKIETRRMFDTFGSPKPSPLVALPSLSLSALTALNQLTLFASFLCVASYWLVEERWWISLCVFDVNIRRRFCRLQWRQRSHTWLTVRQ